MLADQSSVASNFWMRAIPQSACSDNLNPTNIKGVVYYGTSPETPTTTGYSYTDSCDDEAASDLVPYLSQTVSAEAFDDPEAVTLGRTSAGLFRWYLNSTTMITDWADPTLLQIYDGNASASFNTSDAVIQLDGTADSWAYAVITTTLGVPHPIHLHGFDYAILAQGTGTYSASSVTLDLDNPPRRDTAMLPASGYLVLAFRTDNPGAWLMHCHIGWHTSEGFAVQFVVRETEIPALVDYDTLSETCEAWETYVGEKEVEQEDSGI